MNRYEFINNLNNLGINITKLQEEKLEKYFNYLIEYNSHTNLTAITKKEDVYEKHFYDSLTITKGMDLNKVSTLLDIGTGAGFPGIVLKIFYPHLKLTLLDSNNKKTTFLNNLINILELNDVIVVNNRAEDYAKNHLNEFDLVTSRAVAFMDIIITLSMPFVKKEGKIILMKGNLDNELKILATHKQELNIKEFQILNLNEDNSRNLVIINKNNENIKLLNYQQIIKRNKLWNKIKNNENFS